MAPRANWKGYLKLSLVSCAVALYPASSTASRVSFNTLNKKTGNKVKRIYVDPQTGEEVGSEDQAKGYPVSKTEFITVTDEELEAVRIESSHTVDIEKFVPRSQIDPRFMDAPYYIAPDDRVAQEAFAVIRDAMANKDVVALGRVVISRRERVIMIEPWGKGLLGTVLRYGYEVRNAETYFEDIPSLTISKDMHDMAELILQRKLGEWKAEEVEVRYEEAITALIKSKEAGRPAAAPADAPRPSNVVNLMQALRQSIEREKAAEQPRRKPAPEPAAVVNERKMAPSKPRKGKDVPSPAAKDAVMKPSGRTAARKKA